MACLNDLLKIFYNQKRSIDFHLLKKKSDNRRAVFEIQLLSGQKKTCKKKRKLLDATLHSVSDLHNIR